MRGVDGEDSISEKDLVQAPILGALSVPRLPTICSSLCRAFETSAPMQDCSIKVVKGAQDRPLPIVSGVHDRHCKT